MVITNLTLSKAQSSEISTTGEVIVQCIFYFGILVPGSLFNGGVLWLFKTQRSLQNITNLWVASLCASQISIALFTVPIALVSTVTRTWIFGYTFCQIYGYFTIVFRTVSILSVAAIALDRYQVVSRPFAKRMSRNVAKALIGCLWWSAIVLCLPPLFGVGIFRFSSSHHLCQFGWGSSGSALIFTSFYITTVFVSTLIATIGSYFLIYKFTKLHVAQRTTTTITRSKSDNQLSRRARNNNNSAPRDVTQPTNKKRILNFALPRHNLSVSRDQNFAQSRVALDERTGRTIALVLLVFVLAWIPYFSHALYVASGGRSRSSFTIEKWTEFFVSWLSLTTCIWDPLLYAICTKNFQGKHFCFWTKDSKKKLTTNTNVRTVSTEVPVQKAEAHSSCTNPNSLPGNNETMLTVNPVKEKKEKPKLEGNQSSRMVYGNLSDLVGEKLPRTSTYLSSKNNSFVADEVAQELDDVASNHREKAVNEIKIGIKTINEDEKYQSCECPKSKQNCRDPTYSCDSINTRISGTKPMTMLSHFSLLSARKHLADEEKMKNEEIASVHPEEVLPTKLSERSCKVLAQEVSESPSNSFFSKSQPRVFFITK